MYYIYEIIGVKVGCTEDMIRRQKEQLSKGVMILLECHMDIQEASRRERELQVEKGYRVDSKSYTNVRKNQILTTTPEARKKAIANTDFKAKAANTDYKVKVANTDYSKMDFKAIMSHLQRGIIGISTQAIRTKYSGMEEAARQLTLKTGIKFNAAGISNVCSPKRPNCKTYKGYTFEYA